MICKCLDGECHGIAGIYECRDWLRREVNSTGLDVLERRDKRIAELENELLNAAAALEQAYGGLPSDKFPGPPTSLVEHMRAVACGKK